MGSYTNPTVQDFKDFFVRDFPYGVNIDENVLDADISRAQLETNIKINEGIMSTQEFYTLAHNYLSAHHLIMNIRASSQGLSSKFSWAVSSKSVGSVSTSQAIPNDIVNNPVWNWYTQSGYGVEYIMMIYPFLSGAFGSVGGATLP